MRARSRQHPRRQGGAANARRILGELILIELVRAGGRARAADVLHAVRQASEQHVPAAWKKPHPPYHSRIELYTAFERATLRDKGLLDPSERGFWKLTAAGWDQARKVSASWNNGATRPKVSSDELLRAEGPSWLGRLAGSLRDEPDFDEVLKLGREARHRDRANGT